MADTRYPVHQRVFMVLQYQTTMNYEEVRRRFRKEFDTKDLPTKETIKSTYNNFKDSGSVQDHLIENVGPHVITTSDENVEKVRKHFETNPKCSIRQAAAQLNLSYYAVQKILTKKLDFFPYKISIHQPLASRDQVRRFEFANHLLSLIDSGEIDLKKIWFSDEAHFWLHGYVNKQNFRIWGSENPHFIIVKPLHPKKVTVWMALNFSTNTPAIVFRHTVTSASYSELLKTKFFDFCKRKKMKTNYWFMQDGARPHRTAQVFSLLHNFFGSRLIGLDAPSRFAGAIEWPPYSPDLNPCDFWLWSFLKDYVYKKNPENLQELECAINDGVKSIDPDVLKRVIENFVVRLQFIVSNEGRHIENILN